MAPVARAAVYSRALMGMEAPLVTVETHLQNGLPGFVLVGLPEVSVRESRARVKSAVQNCNLPFPHEQRIVVNLAPADLVKEGARFDLAIAVSVLVAEGELDAEAVKQFEFVGELGLYGDVRPTRGVLCAALAARHPQSGTARTLIAPHANRAETRLLGNARVRHIRHLSEVVPIIRGLHTPPVPEPLPDTTPVHTNEFDHVLGQQAAKRAVCVAAAGGHHLLMVGPPGTGKTMLARCLADLLPPLTDDEWLEVVAIRSVSEQAPDLAGGKQRPFREPHHSVTAPALIGGGPLAQPGDISLAHRGVLFLDEMPHFKPAVLNLLREPLESRRINLSRARYRVSFPAAFQLVGAMNPCPAGRVCREGDCRCSPAETRRYQARLSGPLLDRIDLHISVPELPEGALGRAQPTAPAAEALRRNIADARARQLERQGCLNAALDGHDLLERAHVSSAAETLLVKATRRYQLSARSFHKTLRVARSIADLAESASVDTAHAAEALSYRALDWEAGIG